MISTIFSTIASEYLEAKQQRYANHPLAHYIRHDSIKSIEHANLLPNNNYKIKGSSGQGSWATIPWIAFFDKELTQGAQQGYYIVYLFQAHMKGVYLSLNQGWTEYKKKYHNNAKQMIELSAERWKEDLMTTIHSSTFNTSRINLNSKKELAIGYELGHICGIYYDITQLNEDQILSDLSSMINIYAELKRKLKKN